MVSRQIITGNDHDILLFILCFCVFHFFFLIVQIKCQKALFEQSRYTANSIFNFELKHDSWYLNLYKMLGWGSSISNKMNILILISWQNFLQRGRQSLLCYNYWVWIHNLRVRLYCTSVFFSVRVKMMRHTNTTVALHMCLCVYFPKLKQII